MQVEGPELAGTQARVLGDAAAHHHVEAFLDHVHQAVAEVQVQFDAGVAAHEGWQHNREQAQHQRQADPQATAGLLGVLRQLVLGCLQLAENAPAAFEEQRAFHREVDAAGVAVEQADAQVLFQAGDALAHRRGGDAQHATGGDEALAFGDLDEEGEAVEAFHGVSDCGLRFPLSAEY